MDLQEARGWLVGKRSMINIIPQEPFETWNIRIAQADAAMKEQAYWLLRASTLDTPATPPKDEAKKIVNKIDEECIKTDYCGHVFVDRYEMFFILSVYADSIRKQCVRQAVNDWFLNPRIDHNETTLEAAIMRKE